MEPIVRIGTRYFYNADFLPIVPHVSLGIPQFPLLQRFFLARLFEAEPRTTNYVIDTHATGLESSFHRGRFSQTTAQVYRVTG